MMSLIDKLSANHRSIDLREMLYSLTVKIDRRSHLSFGNESLRFEDITAPYIFLY